MFHWWRNDDVALAMLTEVNLYWPKIPMEDGWKERVKAVRKPVHSSLAWNIHQKRMVHEDPY